MSNSNSKDGTEVPQSTEADVTTSCQTIAKPLVVGSAFKPKQVNNGNVFGTGNWYTHYCGNCGSQLSGKVEKCEGSNPFDKGCGSNVEWS